MVQGGGEGGGGGGGGGGAGLYISKMFCLKRVESVHPGEVRHVFFFSLQINLFPSALGV